MAAAMIITFAAMGISIWLLIWRTERGQSLDITGVDRSLCSHHLYGRLQVYVRPIRRFGRKKVFNICAGCGKGMGR